MKNAAFRFLNRLLPMGAALGLVLVCGACASSTPPRAELRPVNTLPPNSTGSLMGTEGFLVVETPQELHFDERSARRFPHTGYSIYTPDGKRMLQYIPNRVGMDETPTLVPLPSGTYLVEARTVYHRPVSFPVLIRPKVTTTVNLEGDLTPPRNINGEFYSVQFRGHTIGWAMETAK